MKGQTCHPDAMYTVNAKGPSHSEFGFVFISQLLFFMDPLAILRTRFAWWWWQWRLWVRYEWKRQSLAQTRCVDIYTYIFYILYIFATRLLRSLFQWGPKMWNTKNESLLWYGRPCHTALSPSFPSFGAHDTVYHTKQSTISVAELSTIASQITTPKQNKWYPNKCLVLV